MGHVTSSPVPLARTNHMTQSRLKESGKYMLAESPGGKWNSFGEWMHGIVSAIMFQQAEVSFWHNISHKSERKL